MVRTLIKACFLLLLPLVISPARSDEALYKRLTDRLEAAEDAMKWQEAIRLTNEILRRCQKEDYVKHETRLAEIGNYQLNLLDVDGAQKSCENVLAELKRMRFGGGWAEEISFYNLARIANIRGDHRNALYWLRKYEHSFGNGCGNCGQGKDGDAYLHRVVWRAGLLPSLEAKAALKRIIAGEYIPRGGRIENGRDLIGRGVVSRFLFVPFVNEAGDKYDTAAKLAEKQTEDALKQLTPFQIVRRAEMEAKANELKLRMPLSESDVQKVGRALGVHAILEGRLAFVNPSDKPDDDYLNVGMRMYAYHIETGGRLEIEGSTGKIASITPAGVITEYQFSFFGVSVGIATGSDGNIWFSDQTDSAVWRFNLSTGSFTEFHLPTSNSFPGDMTLGADGNIWVTEQAVDKYARVTPDGVITEFTSLSAPGSIAAGPDGNLCITSAFSPQVARVNPTTLATTIFPIPSPASNIRPGNRNNLLFTEFAVNKIASITTDGVVTESVEFVHSEPTGITAGVGNKVWFLGFGNNRVYETFVPR